MSLISAIAFVPQGHAAEFPTKYNLSEEEFERIQGLSALHLSSARSDLALAKKDESADADEWEEEEGSDKDEKITTGNASGKADDDLAEYNLDDYDNEEEGEQMGIFNNIKGLAFHSRGEADPYITLDGAGADSDDEEREDLQILPTDNVILAAKTEDDVSHLEVYIYEEDSANLYVHHDLLLPSFPLCLEWINFNPQVQSDPTQTSNVNHVAIGTFEPDIEIWDLDTLDALYPKTILGAKAGTKRRKKKNDKYHIDAILGLSANPNAKNLLASASADETLKLWDLTSGSCAKSYTFHSDKVSAVQWNPKNATIMATGGYDRRTIISDARIPDKPAQSYAVGSDVENVSWDPFNENIVYTSTDEGLLFAHDIRNTKPLWRIQAHDSTLSAFSVSPAAPGLIATGGQDKQIKLWSTITEKPTMLTSRDFDIGKVFSLGFLPGQGMQLVAGGSNGIVRVWDTMTNPGVRKAFKSNTAIAKKQARTEAPNSSDDLDSFDQIEDRVIGVADKDGPESDESDSDTEVEMEEGAAETMDLEDIDASESEEDEDDLMENADFQGDEGWQKEQSKRNKQKK